MTQEQPEQNDHRDRHAQEPEQDSSSHHNPPIRCSCRRANAKGRGWFRESAEAHQCPVLGIEVQGSAGGFGSPFCKSSIECRSGERTKAMLPSRGGRLMVMPAFISFSQVA